MKIRTGMMFAVALVLLGACGDSKTKKTEAEVLADSLPPDEIMSKGVVQLQTSRTKDTVTWRGKCYHYEIVREADAGLPKVTDESGNLFSDNHIDLTISCEGNSVYKKRFTKSSFDQFLDEGFRKNGILEGLVFDVTLPEGLRFATSVSYPRSDLFIPLIIVVDANGNITINKDKILDAESTVGEYEETDI